MNIFDPPLEEKNIFILISFCSKNDELRVAAFIKMFRIRVGEGSKSHKYVFCGTWRLQV